MKRKLLFIITAIGISLLLSPLNTRAQSTDMPKYEVAADFTSITFGPGDTKLGLGGRLTYNLNKHAALEAAGYFFPKKCEFCLKGRRNTEGLFGVKVGKRFEKWGIFAKVRPGVLSIGDGQFDYVSITTNSPLGPIFNLKSRRLTAFVADVGGVLEYYPSKRIVTRLDFGNTIIRYPSRTNTFAVFDSTTGTYVLTPFKTPAETRGTIQDHGGGWVPVLGRSE